MNSAVLDQRETYREVNSVTGSVDSVLFGTETLSELPLTELIQDFGLNISACNRSVEEAVLADAFELLNECVFELRPLKVFLNFGETDLLNADFDQESFVDEYRRLIEIIRARSGCTLFVVSVLSKAAQAQRLNRALRALAEETDCCFVDAADVFAHAKPRLRLFSELVHYMRGTGWLS